MNGLRLWDTCSYVRRFAEAAIERIISEDIRRRRFLLCSVVAMELYAGTRDVASKRALDVLVRHLASLDLVVSPELRDYQRVGAALRRYRLARGSIDPRAHFRDALIAVCAARRGAMVVTENVKDLERWSRWLGTPAKARVVRPGA
ncbi:MAG: hypothetical protein HYY06_15045 [Deltaproteobacteria bacterium]|nr:hypothetical protein [Deltaproteobacteria bacterium]